MCLRRIAAFDCRLRTKSSGTVPWSDDNHDRPEIIGIEVTSADNVLSVEVFP
jgi:hypothetical protein